MAKGEFVGQRLKQLVCTVCNCPSGLYETDLNKSTGRIEHSCDMCGAGMVVRVQGKNGEHVEVTQAGTKRRKTLVLLRTHGHDKNLKYIAVHSGFFVPPNEEPTEGLKRQKRLDKLQFEFPEKPLTLENYSTMDGTKVKPGTLFIHMDTILVPKHTVGYNIHTDYNRNFPEHPDSWIKLFPQLRFSRMS